MEKRIIVEGNCKAIRDIMRENRIRVERGDVKFVELGEHEKESVPEARIRKREKDVDSKKELGC